MSGRQTNLLYKQFNLPDKLIEKDLEMLYLYPGSGFLIRLVVTPWTLPEMKRASIKEFKRQSQ
jgi:hypothetical protein